LKLDAEAASMTSIDQHLAELPETEAILRGRQLLQEKQGVLQQDHNISHKRLRPRRPL
jgi:hypothetical protein